MLGYVKVDKGELKVREYEVYCGYYCGVCKSIGKRHGQLPRMALSYDAAFLAVMLASLDAESDMPVQEHCIASPVIKKKTVIRNSAIDYAADVMLILTWYKLADDAADEKKLYAAPAMLLMKRLHRKLRRAYPGLCSGIEEKLSELSALEKDKCDSIDMAAESFSKIMELIFAEGIRTVYGSSCRELEDTFARIGYHMGKWIYLIDAVDDIEDNACSGAYNPLFHRFSYDSSKETLDAFRERIGPVIRFNLYHYLAVLSQYAGTLDIKKNKGIIENIIYLGLNRKTEEIITRKDRNKQL